MNNTTNRRDRGAHNVWQWAEHVFDRGEARADVEHTIAAALAQSLDDDRTGTVVGPDGRQYRISVTVRLLPADETENQNPKQQ